VNELYVNNGPSLQRATPVSAKKNEMSKSEQKSHLDLGRILDLNLRKISQIQALEELMKINNLKLDMN
jgi:hypothetical protein